MKINIIEINQRIFAEVSSDIIEINNVQDALDIMANCDYKGARNIIINEKNITPEFFKLSSGIAGEILQKFTNYKVRLAIVGDFLKYPGNSLRDFIYEINKTGKICFVNSIDEAIRNLVP